MLASKPWLLSLAIVVSGPNQARGPDGTVDVVQHDGDSRAIDGRPGLLAAA
jgi:hypothetical protein